MSVLPFLGIRGRFFFLPFPGAVQGSLSVEDGHLHREQSAGTAESLLQTLFGSIGDEIPAMGQQAIWPRSCFATEKERRISV